MQKREADAERVRVLQDINRHIIPAETPTEVVARLPLRQIRQALYADRVIIYQFDQNGESTVTAKSVAKGWLRPLNTQTYTPYFKKADLEKYRRGHIQAIPNIYKAGLSRNRLNHLETFAIKANLVVPIRQGNDLFGLLIAHQCAGPRTWEKTEINFFKQVAAQLELVLDRCELLNQREMATDHARSLAKRQHQQTEKWRGQLVELLSEISQANAATQDINRLVESIQPETIQVIKAMEESPAQTGQRTRLLGEAKRGLDKIRTVSRQIDQLAQSNSEATVSQKSTTFAVKRLLREMNPVYGSPADSLERAQSLQQTIENAYQWQPTVGAVKDDWESIQD